MNNFEKTIQKLIKLLNDEYDDKDHKAAEYGAFLNTHFETVYQALTIAGKK